MTTPLHQCPMCAFTWEPKDEPRDAIRNAIAEAIHEAQRLNQAAGETVFNPAAFQALQAAASILDQGEDL